MTVPRRPSHVSELDALPPAVTYLLEHGELPRDPKLAGLVEAFRLQHPNRRRELLRLRRLWRRRRV
jgi:hypothetical protein